MSLDDALFIQKCYLCSMKKAVATVILLLHIPLAFGQIAIDTAFDNNVKSVYLTRVGTELSRPFLRMAKDGVQEDFLLLEFDLLGTDSPNLRYRIKHCDAEWRFDDLEPYEFMYGMEDGNIENHEFSFTTLHDYVHYKQTIPSEMSQFTASGNYVVEVFPDDSPDSLMLRRRFSVYEDAVGISASVEKTTTSASNLSEDQEVDVAVSAKRDAVVSLNPQYMRVFVQQNKRVDMVHELHHSEMEHSRIIYRWSEANIFPGGNSFRYFDMSTLRSQRHHIQRIEQWGGENFAFLQPEDVRGGKSYINTTTLNGGMKTNTIDRTNPDTEADYAWVNFSVPMKLPYMNGSVHVVGDLTDWSLGEKSRMEWQQNYKAYTLRLLLKQGYYSYQLVFLPVGQQTAQTAPLEGDFFATENNYTVYVYFRQPGDRYDRLLAIKEIRKSN